MSREPFVEQLADLCRAEPTLAKWVFVPAHALGATLGDRLARDGCDWANLRFVTPLDVAVRMAAPFLLERGINPSEDSLGPALFMRLLLASPEAPGYFRPMAEHPSMSEALWGTMRELRYAGLGAGDLPRTAFTSPAKHAELVALASAYEQDLETRRVADMPMVIREAARHRDWCPIHPGDVVIETPDAWWSPLVRQFLDHLPGRRIRPRALEMPGTRLPPRAASVAAPVEFVGAGPGPDAARLRFLLSPAAAPPPRHDGTLALFHAGGRDAEVAEVLRRIVEAGEPLDHVEIVCASDDYARLVWERAQRLAWPVSLSAGIPAGFTRPGRLLLRLCEWVSGGFVSADLRRLLQSGDCTPGAFGGQENDDGDGAPAGGALTPGQAARLLLKAQTTWGRATYAASLARLGGEYAQRAGDREASDEDRAWNARKAAQTRTLAEWLDGVLASVPAAAPPVTGAARDSASGPTVVLREVAAAVAAFLTANASRASALDAMAVVALDSAMQELASELGLHRCDLASALRLVRARIESLSIGRDRPRPGALHVSSLHDAAHDGRPRVYVVGLVEGGVFPPAIEDAILLDVERRSISPLLRTSAGRLDEAVYAAMSRLAAIGASASHVCLSYSCRDTRQFRDSFPSWIILQAFRLMKGDASLTYGDLEKALGEPRSAVPAAPGLALTGAEWWLAVAARIGAARPHVLAAFPALAAGVRAEEARASEAFTEFDGYVKAAGPVLDPSRNGRGTSATTLERAAACPFRHFLQQGLGVRPIDEPSSDADAWLDPLTKGSEFHDLFARLMRSLRDERQKPELTRDLDRLRAWGRERLDALAAEMPPPSDEVYARESREFLEDLEAFLLAECDGHHGSDPVGFEVSFGHAVDGLAEPLAGAEPLVLDLGGKRRLAFHGRIDRINRVRPHEYEVVDYKTGSFWPDNWKGTFAGGTRLQHAVYGLAAEPLLGAIDRKARVTQGVYVFPSVKGHRHRKLIAAPPKGQVLAVLRDLTDVIGDGVFVSADAEDACRWCEFSEACRPGAVDAVASMRGSPGNTVLGPFLRLRQHD